jgi:hypothetical protein
MRYEKALTRSIIEALDRESQKRWKSTWTIAEWITLRKQDRKPQNEDWKTRPSTIFTWSKLVRLVVFCTGQDSIAGLQICRCWCPGRGTDKLSGQCHFRGAPERVPELNWEIGIDHWTQCRVPYSVTNQTLSAFFEEPRSEEDHYFCTPYQFLSEGGMFNHNSVSSGVVYNHEKQKRRQKTKWEDRRLTLEKGRETHRTKEFIQSVYHFGENTGNDHAQ